MTCGLKSNYDELNIYAMGMEEKTTFSFERLRFKTDYWKTPSYSTCSYQVMIPPGGYSSGKLYVQFKKIESGVTIYISSDEANFTVIQETS